MLCVGLVTKGQSLFVKQTDGSVHEYAIESVEDVVFGATSGKFNQLSITYAANDGTDSIVVKSYLFSQIVSLPTPDALSLPEPKGMAFAGWNTAPDGSGISFAGDGSGQFPIVSDMKLYAQWCASANGLHYGHEWVDLGLPSGILWASCNIGAEAPEEYGLYYAWGEVQHKEVYDWSTYKHGWSERGLIKYCTEASYALGYVDNKSRLDFSDDAAAVNWGGKWRIPTKDEVDELGQYCEFSHADGGCWRVTSKVNGNSMIWPNSGFMEGPCHRSHIQPVFSCSDVVGDRPYMMRVCSSGEIVGSERYIGLPVRPVLDKSQPIVTYNYNCVNTTVCAVTFRSGDRLRGCGVKRAGHFFVGWNTSADGSGKAYAAGEVVALSEDVTLYAQWKANPKGSYNGHEWVDLGLPSGIKWATYNVGATKPSEYGNYFAWGETSPAENKYFCNYEHMASGGGLIKYCCDEASGQDGFVDNLTTLEGLDDAAAVNWGGEWRMPTRDEFSELVTWTTQTDTTLFGVNGFMLTSKVNGNSVFFPSAGFCYSGDHSIGKAGVDCCYWSSSLWSGETSFNAVSFESESYSTATWLSLTQNYRETGCSVRPVYAGK